MEEDEDKAEDEEKAADAPQEVPPPRIRKKRLGTGNAQPVSNKFWVGCSPCCRCRLVGVFRRGLWPVWRDDGEQR